MVSSHHDIEEDDYITIDIDALSGALFRVSDKQVDNIGITETIAVTLVSDAHGDWSFVGTTADSYMTLEEIDGDGSHTVFWKDMEKKIN